MYKVIYKFADREDSNHIYNVGDTYPREGVEPTEERIKELKGGKNKIGEPLIKSVEDKKTAKKPKDK